MTDLMIFEMSLRDVAVVITGQDLDQGLHLDVGQDLEDVQGQEGAHTQVQDDVLIQDQGGGANVLGQEVFPEVEAGVLLGVLVVIENNTRIKGAQVGQEAEVCHSLYLLTMDIGIRVAMNEILPHIVIT